ncbi:uncharacterized protein [Clytia hemisphaerica]|uniref:Secreted protein n=1 Tax=Clytia hemisphaerica TaxID=252671 RepID=A0A7M5X5X1_9CNID
MKIAVLCLLFGLICANPIEQNDEEVACTALFSNDVCDGYELAGLEDEMEESNAKRQMPPPGGNGGGVEDVLEKLLLKKLEFLVNLGLLKRIPLLGKFVHDLVQSDPEGVAKALNGGIFAMIRLVTKLLASGALG